MHICDSSRHNEMSKPVFWLHNLEWRHITLSLHTFDWGQTMLLSLASVIDFSCFIDLQVVYWIEGTQWSGSDADWNHYSAVFIFQLKSAINRFKVFVLMENDKSLLGYSIDFNICKKMIFWTFMY